jgi:hypothetical protein
MEQTASVQVINPALDSRFTYNNVDMLHLTINNFVVKLPNNIWAERRINSVIKKQTEDFFLNAVNNLYPNAINDYIARLNNDIPFNGYGAALNYVVTYNQNCYLSTYSDNYQFTGGAHGITIRKSDTFNLNTGNTVRLNSFFDNLNARKVVLNEIVKQADLIMQNNPGIYFDNYKELIVKNFNANSFYLTPSDIVIYYQQYDIAPYVTGIVEFTIPYALIPNPPKCRNIF